MGSFFKNFVGEDHSSAQDKARGSIQYQPVTIRSNPKGGTQRLLTGWRRAGLINTILIGILTIILAVLLFYSLYELGEGWSSIAASETSNLFTGDCHKASRLNIGLHLGINILSSLVLASSNYFMQILSAPTRKNIDDAHRRNRSLEVGVQSFKNLWSIGPSKALFWFALALSSLPHHLLFNSSIAETKASTDFFLLAASEGFIRGEPYSLPGVGAPLSEYGHVDEEGPKEDLLENTVRMFRTWEEISLSECIDRYDNPDISLTTYRHVLVVLSNLVEGETKSWTTETMRPDLPEEHRTADRNSLWLMTGYYRNDAWVAGRQLLLQGGPISKEHDDQNKFAKAMDLDPNSGLVTFVASNVTLRADRCLSEPFVVPCELRVYNFILAIVCLANLLKFLLCLLTLFWFAKHNPLVTPGDAIESFIVDPDPTTKDLQDQLPPRRRIWSNISRKMWLFSYVVIFGGLSAALYYYTLAVNSQPLKESFFGPDTRNQGEPMGGSDKPLSDILTVNLPHLIFSAAYVIYNGLFTRMVSGLEWTSYGTAYKPLRVSIKRGMQKSTYRLQLPFRWSIPLISASSLLHWLISNSIFLRKSVVYKNLPPYKLEEGGTVRQLITPYDWADAKSAQSIGYSSKTILISLMVALVMALIPFVMGVFRHRGNMMLSKSDSAVMSVACHSLEGKDGHGSDRPGEELEAMVFGELKWGVVAEREGTFPGRVAFGTKEGIIGEPGVGQVYRGVKG